MREKVNSITKKVQVRKWNARGPTDALVNLLMAGKT
jgi:hypothetical protein